MVRRSLDATRGRGAPAGWKDLVDGHSDGSEKHALT